MEFRESNSSSGRKSKALLENVTTYRTIPGSCEYVESGLLFLFFSKKYEIIKQKQYSSLVDTVYMVDYYKINVLQRMPKNIQRDKYK